MIRVTLPEDPTRTLTVSNATGKFLTDLTEEAFDSLTHQTSLDVLKDLGPCPPMEYLIWSTMIHQAVGTIALLRKALLCNMKDGKVCVHPAPSAPDAESGEKAPLLLGLPSLAKRLGSMKTVREDPSSGSPEIS